jgi:TonB family protein
MDDQATLRHEAAPELERVLRVIRLRPRGSEETALLRGEGRVTIGRTRKNDIVVRSPEAPRSTTLLWLDRDGCRLSTRVGIAGSVWLEGAGVSMTLDELRATEGPRARGRVRLDDTPQGRIEAWGAQVMFFVFRAPRRSRPGDDALPRIARVAGVASALLAAALCVDAMRGHRPDEPALDRARKAWVVHAETARAEAGALASTAAGATIAPPDIVAPAADLTPPSEPSTATAREGSREDPSLLARGIALRAAGPRDAPPAIHRRERAPTLRPDGDDYVADGLLDENAAAREVERRRAAIDHCFERALRRDPRLSGRVVVRFTIDGRGDVVDLDVASDTVGDRALRSDLERVLRSWRFPSPARGRMRLLVPLVFRPPGRA